MGHPFLPVLAQSYGGSYSNSSSSSGGGAVAILIVLIYLALIVVVIAGMWKVFTKAGKPGWACIVPIYNLIVLLEIAGKPLWWIVLYLIPFVNLVVAIIVSVEIAKRFGKGAGFAIGMVFLPFIFFPILGFGSAQYMGGSPMRPQGFAPIMPQA